MKPIIKFGTDGWRSVIADGFTFDNVRRVAQAVCDVARQNSKSRVILVGYDRRFFSQRFAETAAQVAVANGYKVEISSSPISSPALSFQVKSRKAAIGFMITASHNPYEFNGFKLKGVHGGSVDKIFTDKVEEKMDLNPIKTGQKVLKKTDFVPSYLSALRKLAKLNAFGKLKGPVVFDAMHGPGGDLLERLAPSANIVYVRKEADPLFGGENPEPIETNLNLLKDVVARQHAAIGIAVDGDVDRIGVVDEKGRFLPPHTVMPLILLHLIENRKLKGKVVQTVSMGYLPGRIAKQFNLPFEEVSVGFKYIAQKMLEGKVLLGGEESGGYGVGLWSPERDGLLCALLLVELLAQKKMPLSALVDDLEKRFGVSRFKRVDFTLHAPVDKTAWTTRIQSHLNHSIAGLNIKNINATDGIKIVTDDDSWVLLRPSGTEPLIRTYAEGTSSKVVENLLIEAEKLVHMPVKEPKKSHDEAAKKNKKKREKSAK